MNQDWRLEMMKTLDRPETFFQKIFKTFFKQNFSKKVNVIFLVTGFATVLQIAIHCQIPCCNIKFCCS